MAAGGTENNAYAKFLGDKQRALWYVLVFTVVINWSERCTGLAKVRVRISNCIS